MNTLSRALILSLLLAPVFAFGAHPSDNEIRALIGSMKHSAQRTHKRVAALSDPLIRFSASPGQNVEQGQELTVFATLNVGFQDSETFIDDVKLDGTPITLEHPSSGLWIFNGGAFTELLSHTLEAKVYIQDAAQAGAIRDAITSLEADIANLNAQIEEATDPQVIADLTAQRDEKQNLKNSLVTALANLKTIVGTEQFTFTVVPATTGTDFPKITSVSPNFGKMDEATSIAIHGANFPSDSTLAVKVGGVDAASASVQSSSVISATTPVFSTGGSKDVEIRFTKDGKTKNAFFRNAFFAGDSAAAVEVNPVAVAGSNQTVALGASATFSGSGSFDPNGHEISYAWQVIAKPTGSSIQVPTNPPGTDVSFSLTPDVPGTYVLSLVVAKASPAMTSAPSLTVLEVSSTNHAPSGTAASITTGTNTTKTSQISVSDADTWQSRSFFVTKQSAFGTVTVNSSGLVTFVASGTAGSDTVEVTVVDNGTPPLSGVVSIPVTVISNLPPVINGGAFAYQRGGKAPYLAFLSATTSAVDPDGTIVSAKWNFGDGSPERFSTDTSPVVSIMHDYANAGPYTATLTVTDNLGAQTSASVNFTVVNTDMPKTSVTADVISGATPLTVHFTATATDDNGIASTRWLWGDGSPEETGSGLFTRTHTFNTPGVYNVRFRARDPLRANTDGFVKIYAGVTPPATGTPPQATFVTLPAREQVLGSTFNFDGSYSFDPNPSGSIVSYDWNYNDYLNCPSDGCTGTGITTSHVYQSVPTNNFPQLMVTSATGGTSFVGGEIFHVISGHAPRGTITLPSITGVAPFTVNPSAILSYDPDGSIVNYNWDFADYGACPSDGCRVTGQSASHTYTTPGVYTLLVELTDNDGNKASTYQTVTVNPSYREMVHQLDEGGDDSDGGGSADPAREEQRRVLTGACAQKSGQACYFLANMYAEDGDAYTAQQFKAKSCELGYQAACVK